MAKRRAKRSYKQDVLLELYARSGNQCAFPGCKEKVYLDRAYVGNIYHIEAVSEGGPRYDERLMEDGKVDDISNLILLCPKHHKIVDSQPETYTPDVLRVMKERHEEDVARKMNGEGREEEDFYTKLTLIFRECDFDSMFKRQSFDEQFPKKYFDNMDNAF